MLWRILREARHYPWRTGLVALALAALAWLTGLALDRFTWLHSVHHAALLGAITVGGGSFGWWVIYRLVMPMATGKWVARRDDEANNAGGVASRLDIGELASAGAMRKRATVLRPSLRGVSWWRRRRTPVTAYAVKLVRSGWFSPTACVWSACEEVTLRIGGPRTGKTGSMACHALDAPGALVVTSTRTDLLQLTRDQRGRMGRVEIFNPTGLGWLASTVRWSPLAGCRDFPTARRRAGDLIPESTGEAERWDNQARGLLAILLHAAALSGGRVKTVVDWPGARTPSPASRSLPRSLVRSTNSCWWPTSGRSTGRTTGP